MSSIVTQQKAILHLANIVDGLSHWIPHPGQINIIQSVFKDGKKLVVVECGRGFGKTDVALYILWRQAQMFADQQIYYYGPAQTQVREIAWASKRLQDFGPREWLKPGDQGVNNAEMRLKFRNGSFIKADGADNVERIRGPKPHMIVMEEAALFRKEFWPIMQPNLVATDGIVVAITSPPEQLFDDIEPNKPHHFIRLADQSEKSPRGAYFHGTSYDNPKNPPEALNEIRDELIANGEQHIWEREYLARRIQGGAASLFPMFDRLKHVKTVEWINEHKKRDRHKLRYYCLADPGSSTVFGMLFVAVNVYKPQLYIMDEIYETDISETAVSKIWPRAEKVIDSIYNNFSAWDFIYDEAATDFWVEMNDQFPYVPFRPTHKATDVKNTKKEGESKPGISLIRTQLQLGQVVISEKCRNLIWELENYKRNKKGQIPKKNDHLIDDWRYLNADLGFTCTPTKIPSQYGKQAYTIEEDEEFEFNQSPTDWPVQL